MIETFSTKTTVKVPDVLVYQLMMFQFTCCTETPNVIRTAIANCPIHHWRRSSKDWKICVAFLWHYV